MKNFIAISVLSILLSQPSFGQSAPVPSPAEHCSVEKDNAELRYPDSLKGSGIQGTVLIEAVIGKNGCAEDVKVVRRLHPELDDIAKQLVNSWKFQPAMKSGKPVKVLVRIEVAFKDKSQQH
jgi:TonB family protein